MRLSKCSLNDPHKLIVRCVGCRESSSLSDEQIASEEENLRQKGERYYATRAPIMWFRNAWADLDGAAFQAYYCQGCAWRLLTPIALAYTLIAEAAQRDEQHVTDLRPTEVTSVYPEHTATDGIPLLKINHSGKLHHSQTLPKPVIVECLRFFQTQTLESIDRLTEFQLRELGVIEPVPLE